MYNSKNKIVVIDGLARSGTTLLASIINSQENSVCYRGAFHEFLACDIGRWKRDYALHSLLGHNDKVYFRYKKNFLHKIFSLLYKRKKFLSYDKLIANTLNRIKKRDQTSLITIDEWISLLLDKKIKSFFELDQLYQTIAIKSNVNLLAFRWNQGLAYINKFLRQKNYYWISIIRNPMDRAVSDKKTFKENYEIALKYTNNYGKLLNQVRYLENHIIVFYEDLLNDPNYCIKKIYNRMNIKLGKINFDLYQSSGKKYKIETSDLIDHGQNHTEGVEFKGFDLSKVNKYKNVLNKETIDSFMSVMNKYDIYARYLKD